MLLRQKMIVVSMAVAAGLMVSTAGSAQTATQAPPPAAPAGLNLTQAQRDEIRTLREAQRKDAQPLREKMRAARQQLREAMRADVPDEAAIRSAAGAVAALQADQAVRQARARTQFLSVLTPEQQARMQQARERAAQRAQRPMWRQRQLRQDALRRWRGWILSLVKAPTPELTSVGDVRSGSRRLKPAGSIPAHHQLKRAPGLRGALALSHDPPDEGDEVTRRASRPLTANSISVE